MKKILNIIYAVILILLLSYQSFAQTIRYVDGSLTGTDNGGTSWADAWEALDQINWNDLSGGGILYVSGGADSLIYNERFPTIAISGASNNYVRIFAGKYSPSPSGHSGTVWIDGNDVNTDPLLTMDNNCGEMNYLWVKGLSFRETANNAIYIHCDVNNVILDSLHIIDFRNDGINVIGNDDYYLTEGGVAAEDITITNCLIESYKNSVGRGEDNCIYVQMVAGLNINNTISHQRNQQIGVVYPNHEHIDPLQTHVVRDVKIYNNIFVLDSAVMGHGMILGVQSRPSRLDTVIIYNNYIYADGHLQAGGNPYINGFVTRWYGYVNSVYPPTFVIHNTVSTSNGGENTVLQEYGIDAFINNIICQFGTNGQDPAVYGGEALDAFASSWNGDQCYVDSCRGNLMWNEWTDDMSFGGNQFVGSGGSPTGAPANWAEWTNSSWGGTGVNANPLFENNVKFGDVNRLDIASNSPAIDAGVTEWWESWLVSKGLPTTDIHGNSRDWSNPDAGAMEYQSGTADTTGIVSFTSVTNAELNSYHIAYGVVSGIDSTAHVYTATSDSFAVGYPYTLGLGVQSVENGDTIAISNIASGSYSTANINYVILSGTSRSFTVTTKAEPIVPSGNGGVVRGSDGKIWKDSTGKVIKTQ